MWIKIISKCQSIPIRMAKMKKTDPSKCWWKCELQKSSHSAGALVEM
jgi:hypothetical protein